MTGWIFNQSWGGRLKKLDGGWSTSGYAWHNDMQIGDVATENWYWLLSWTVYSKGEPCIIQKATINAKNRHKKEDFFDRWLQPISRHPSVREPVHFSHHPVKMQPPRNLVRFVINLSRPVCGSPGATLTYPVCNICVCLIENGNSDPTEGHFYSRNQDRI